MFYFDYWTAISTLIQVEFIHELAPRSLWLIVFRTQRQVSERVGISRVEIYESVGKDVIAVGKKA